ncbi:MAG: DUF983 domain-containing protein [Bacteroidetes bacterium]|nr:MAG: DUF983 domain-containing protein [Bacteroidota bacterium]
MLKKGQKAYAIFNLKCPRCHEADLFETGSLSFSRPFDMKERCDFCGEDFFPEPGFYYGAMFVSYIFTGFFCIFFVLFFHWVLDWSTEASFALLIAVLGLSFVYIFRLARSLYLGMHVKYDPKAKENKIVHEGKSTAAHFGK